MRPTQAPEIQQHILRVLQLVKIRFAGRTFHGFDPEGRGNKRRNRVRALCRGALQERRIGGAAADDRENRVR